MIAEKKKTRDRQPVVDGDQAPGPQHMQVVANRIDAATKMIHVPRGNHLHPDRSALRLVTVGLPVVDELLPGGTAQGQRRVARAPLIGCEIEQRVEIDPIHGTYCKGLLLKINSSCQ